MISQLRSGPLRTFDYRAVDLRSIAEPVAVLSPVALVVGWQEPVMSLVSVLFVLHSWRLRDFSWAGQGWFAALLGLWAYELISNHCRSSDGDRRADRPSVDSLSALRGRSRALDFAGSKIEKSPAVGDRRGADLLRARLPAAIFFWKRHYRAARLGKSADEPFSQAWRRHSDLLADGGPRSRILAKGIRGFRDILGRRLLGRRPAERRSLGVADHAERAGLDRAVRATHEEAVADCAAGRHSAFGIHSLP